MDLRNKIRGMLNFLIKSLVKDVLIKANSLIPKLDNVSKVIPMLLQNKV